MRRLAALVVGPLLAATASAQDALEGEHKLSMARVAWSPDGKRVATTGEDAFVVVWDADTRKPVAKLEGHDNFVTSLAFLPDGTLISGQLHKILIFWDLATKKEKQRVEAAFPLNDVVLSPDAKRLYAGGRESKLLSWTMASPIDDAATWICEGEVVDVAVSPAGPQVAAACDTGVVVVWDSAKGEILHKLQHGDRSRAAAFSPDGKTLATGGGDGSLKIWDVEKGAPKEGFKCPDLDARTLLYSRDGKTLVAGTAEGELKFIEASTGKVRNTVPIGDSPMVSAALSPDGTRIAAATLQPVIKLVPMK